MKKPVPGPFSPSTAREAIRQGAVGALAVIIGSGVGLLAGAPASAAPVAPHATTSLLGNLQWQQNLPDGGNTITLSSPNEAQLPQGPAVVVGDQGGNVYALNLGNGTVDWTHNVGGPVTSTPSVTPTTANSPLESVFVGIGDASDASPSVDGYQAITPQGGDQWSTQETDPTYNASKHYGVQASLAVGDLQGGPDVTAGSLGENQEALNAGSGAILPGFPWFQGDTNLSTPALADLYSNGATDIVEGGATTANPNAYGQTYQNGGLIRVVRPTGGLGQPEPNAAICQYQSNQEIDSSPAVGEFFDGSTQVGIVDGTGSYWPNASNTDKVIALDSHCNLAWTASLNGTTSGSPALADVLGNGQLQVIEGTITAAATGSVYALDGATGRVLWQTQLGGQITGSVATADLGTGYQDVIAATTNGVDVLDGRTGAVEQVVQPLTGFQNTPLVTDDPDGDIGITLAGYADNSSESYIYHYEVPNSSGTKVDEAGAWPEFHHDPQLTGDAGTAQSIEVPCNAPSSPPAGYYLSASDGGIFAFGNLPFCGSTGSITLNKPVVAMAATHNGGGYWEVASDGGIFAFGNAAFYGSTGGIPLNQPVVGMAVTPDGKGYWLVASDGGIFAFGDAAFYGSTGSLHLNKPIVGMAATPDGKGYWLVASDGGIFAFGDAVFHGSTGSLHLNQPVVGMAATHTGNGYWLVASDGGIFAFGNAVFYGSTGAIHLNQPVVGMEATSTGAGYRFVAADGGIFSFGDAKFYGSTGAIHLNKPVVAMAGF
jgi:outer membrane protein assembly factor BamB